MAKTNPYNKGRKVHTFEQFIKLGAKSTKTSGTNVNGEAELTKKHYTGEKKGAKGIATLAEGENATALADGIKEIDRNRYDEMHGVLPPIYFSMRLENFQSSPVIVVSGFAVSEPADDKNGIPTFGAAFKAIGKYYECTVTLKNKEGKDITFNNYNNYEFSKGNTAELV